MGTPNRFNTSGHGDLVRQNEPIWKSMNTVRAKTGVLRDTVYTWELEKAYHWKEDAACAFLPYTMFEMANSDSLIAEGLTENQIKDLNSDNFAAAQEACNRCPVWHLCYQDAQPEDFQETVRAGLIPLRHNPTHRGRSTVEFTAQPAVRQKIDPSKPCKNGHGVDRWRKRSNSNAYYCASCKDNGRSRPVGTGWRIDPEKPCRKGHGPDWRVTSKGYLECRECERIRSRRRKHGPGKV